MNLPAASIPKRMADLAAEFEQCRKTFIALGEESRQRILIALLENPDGLRVDELAGRISLSRPAVSHHLKILKDAGIISLYKQGTMHFYHVEAEISRWGPLASLLEHITGLIDDVSGGVPGCTRV